ncbi:hypothetical protein [Hymenobacter chitinivorans]|uniref:Uncharacterized protein n=1 Tax=Hymenobacter chitinivorans DSM 11115 TaxID=1121954 RepID=A0A2M9BQP6_9BACT|nr:hypothetical protein [Hymenobacter chitinivorans]PJJ60280.1 hypothetical protein CLV45_1705 [Hymenobacter chitinivorans DSM 11115]
MTPEIRQLIHQLGGTTPAAPDATLPEFLLATSFPHPLYPRSYAEELFGLDEFYAQHQSLYAQDSAAFFEALRRHFFSDHELPYGQDFYRPFRFTPFTKDTPNYGELDDLVTPAQVQQTIPGEPLEFICFCFSYGFPDHYFVCLGDADPQNPTVYGTDHEVFFQEISTVGSLADFFRRYLTPTEFLALARQHFAGRAAG